MGKRKQSRYSSSRILLAEDEETLAVGLEYNLAQEGYQVTWARDGRQALEYFNSREFDLIILDIMLPYHNGFEIAQEVRRKSPQIPILILTARTGVEDRMKGLEIGSDDYLTKPFHLQELLLRVEGMLKRKSWYRSLSSVPSPFCFGNNEVDFENLNCRHADRSFQLTWQEGMILQYLIGRRGQIVSRQELLQNVWNVKSDMETRTVDNFIARLRKYFEPDPAHPVHIISIRSAGYMFREE